MNANINFEITAKAFELMTGLIAPGKDIPRAAYSISAEERRKYYTEWIEKNGETVGAMLAAMSHILGE